MTGRGEENAGLPSFFQDNPWLDVLAQRGAEPTPDFAAPRASPAPAVSRATPVIEPEPIASSPTTTPTAMQPLVSFPRELVVRLGVPSELLEAIRELKEAVIMALSVSQRQATSVPIYIPISVAQMAQAPQVSASPSKPVPPLSPTPCLQHFPPLVGPGREAEPGASGEVICPKCGRPGKLYKHKRGRRAYVLVLHGRQKCYLGPADRVKVNWPSLARRSLLNSAQHGQAGILSPPGLRPSPQVLSAAQQPNWPPLAERWCPGRDLNPGPLARKARMLPAYTTGAP